MRVPQAADVPHLTGPPVSAALHASPMADLHSRLQGLAAFVAELEAPDFDAGHWHPMAPTRDDPDVSTMPWYELSDRADAFLAAVRGNGWVGPFDWMAWAQTAEGTALREDRDALAKATPDQLQRLLTTLVRADRFNEGTLEWAFESGLMAAIARRAATLAAALSLPDGRADGS